MKTLTLLLLFPLFGWGQTYNSDSTQVVINAKDWVLDTVNTCQYFYKGKCYEANEPIPVTIEVQYQRRDLPGLRDCYLINGEPWYKSTAPLTRGKWFKIRCYRYRISENWIKQ